MKKKIIIIVSAINALLLILIGIVAFNSHDISKTLLSQQAADFWAGESEERFSQVSCFFPQSELSSKTSVNSFRTTIDSKLIEAGVEPKEQGSFWSDAYSGQTSVQVEGDKGKSSATAIAVGGDYFLFHPFYLMSGSFISDDTVMQDRVVLDYELAWKLFGGTELEGMTVKIDGKPYYVAGVVKRETDKYSERAFSGDPVIFMSYDALSDAETELGISSYELVMLDPISKFAETTLTKGLAGETGVVVENSKRYSFTSIFSILKNFGDRSMVKSTVLYPYWENAARLTETYIARNYVIIALLAIFPFICLVYLSVILIRLLIKWIKLLAFKIWDAWDDRYGRLDARKKRKQKKHEALENKGSPDEDSTAPDEANAAPDEDSTEPDEDSTAPDEANAAPDEVGAAPDKVGAAPDKKQHKRRFPSFKKAGGHGGAPAKSPRYNAQPPEENLFADRELTLDIENIVREVMSENEAKDRR